MNSIFFNVGIHAFQMHEMERAVSNVLDERTIREIVEEFYYRVKLDPVLAPVFAVVSDWDEHLGRLTEFWSSLMLSSGKYKGNPVALHMLHANRIEPEMFEIWLAHWAAVTNEMADPSTAAAMQARAARIANRLVFALSGNLDPIVAAPQAPAKPYRVSEVFDHLTLPAVLLTPRRNPAGTWAVLKAHEGQLGIIISGERNIVSPRRAFCVPPHEEHQIELRGPVLFQIEFFDHEPFKQAGIERIENA